VAEIGSAGQHARIAQDTRDLLLTPQPTWSAIIVP
jgi:hypothetical protein